MLDLGLQATRPGVDLELIEPQISEKPQDQPGLSRSDNGTSSVVLWREPESPSDEDERHDSLKSLNILDTVRELTHVIPWTKQIALPVGEQAGMAAVQAGLVPTEFAGTASSEAAAGVLQPRLL